MAQSTLDTGDPTVDWELDVTDSRLLWSLAYVFPSVLGGVVVLAGGLVLRLVGSALLDGDLARAVGLVVFAALALLSRRYLPAVLDTELTDPFWARYSRRGVATGSVLGALVLLGSAQLDPAAPFAVFVASWVPLVLTAAFPTGGHADVATETLVVDDTEVPVRSVRTFRAVSVGAFAVCWLSYPRGVPTAPRLVVLPSDYVDVVAELIDSAPESSMRDRSTIGRAERLVAGLFGLGMVAVGPLLWLVLPPGDGQAIALYAGAMFGLFGVVLLRYAHRA